MKDYNFTEILKYYGLHPESCVINEFLKGHINDSYTIDVRNTCAFFLQRINHHVFRDPEGLIENLILVNQAMSKHFGKEHNSYPRIIRNRNKKYFYLDKDGNYWRMMDFVPESRSYNICENTAIAREGAAAFGRFQSIMNNEDPANYIPTIPDFHHLGKRLDQLKQATDKDAFSRAGIASKEIAFEDVLCH